MPGPPTPRQSWRSDRTSASGTCISNFGKWWWMAPHAGRRWPPWNSALTVGAAAADQAKSCGRPHEWTDANIRSSTADPNELFVSLEKYDSEEMASSRETPTTIIHSNTLSNQPLHEKYQVTTNHAQWLCSMYLYRTIFHQDTWTNNWGFC